MAKHPPIYFKVTGRWPFPTDMLRRDGVEPATPADRENMMALSGSYNKAPERLRGEVSIVMVNRDPPHKYWEPNRERWESFGWKCGGTATGALTIPTIDTQVMTALISAPKATATVQGLLRSWELPDGVSEAVIPEAHGALPPAPWSYRLTPRNGGGVYGGAPFFRPICEIHAADGTWIARVAGDTEAQAVALAMFICRASEQL